MPAPEHPRLRSSISGHPDPGDGEFVWLYDTAWLSRTMLRLHRGAIPLLSLFDGHRTIRDMQLYLMREHGGTLVPSQILVDLVEKLDEAVFLEGPRLAGVLDEFRRASVREPACMGSTYAAEPDKLRRQLRRLFTGKNGPGMPDASAPSARNGTGATSPPGRMRGALIPHMDYQRGGHTYGWGFKEVVERTQASLFVIIATSHYSGNRFILTRKHFRTPLGVVPTDQAYVDRLAQIYGDRAFEDEPAHLPEHSIELHVVLLHYLLENRRPFRIVPLLVGSFHDCLEDAAWDQKEDICSMIRALREAEAAAGEEVFYLISGDLAHIGPKFGDEVPVHDQQLEFSRQQDRRLLDHLVAADREAFVRQMAEEQDRRRICGFPPTATFLSVAAPARGRLLNYNQYIEPNGHESVSFASMAFYD